MPRDHKRAGVSFPACAARLFGNDVDRKPTSSSCFSSSQWISYREARILLLSRNSTLRRKRDFEESAAVAETETMMEVVGYRSQNCVRTSIHEILMIDFPNDLYGTLFRFEDAWTLVTEFRQNENAA